MVFDCLERWASQVETAANQMIRVLGEMIMEAERKERAGQGRPLSKGRGGAHRDAQDAGGAGCQVG